MMSYDEEVTVKRLDGKILGECQMLAWVVTQPKKPKWQGEFRAVPGKSFDFAFEALGETVQVVCKDGASAQVIINLFSEGRFTGPQCTFVGTGPAPRSK